MKLGARYAKIMEWSEGDQCFVGTCPALFHGGCHGDDEQTVFAELCDVVDETVQLYERDGRPLPPPSFSNQHGSVILGQS